MKLIKMSGYLTAICLFLTISIVQIGLANADSIHNGIKITKATLTIYSEWRRVRSNLFEFLLKRYDCPKFGENCIIKVRGNKKVIKLYAYQEE